MFHKKILLVSLFLVCLVLVTVSVSSAAPPPQTIALTGWFNIVWGDPEPGSNLPPTENYFLTDDKGTTTEIVLDDGMARAAGGVLALHRQRVRIVGSILSQGTGTFSRVHSQTIQRLGPQAPTAVTGAAPWISIGCMFADEPFEARTLAYLKGMYSSSYPGLDHYWKEQSYNNVDLTGSDAVGWFTLPHPKSYYQNSGGTMDLAKGVQDCTSVADSTVNFGNFDGMNLMFNGDIGLTSFGGSWRSTLDGVTKNWRVTWLMGWAYSDLERISSCFTVCDSRNGRTKPWHLSS